MTKEQRAARDRLIAYAQRPDVYYPPTPKECRAAYELIQAMEKALSALVDQDCCYVSNEIHISTGSHSDAIKLMANARAVLERTL